MPVDYQIRLFDTAGALQAIFDSQGGFLSLTLSQKLNAPGVYMVEIDGDDPRRSLFTLDSIIEFRRQIRADSDNSIIKDWYTEFVGLHRTPVNLLPGNDIKSFRSHGFGATELLQRREIWHQAGTSGASKSAPSETVMKAYADQNIGPNATPGASGRLDNGVMLGVSIAADGATGATWSGGRAYQNLLSVLQEIARFSDLNFRIARTTGALWEFQTFAGVDRTIVGLVSSTGLNGAGNKPVIFSVDQQTMFNVAHSLNRSSEVTAALALGRGEGTNRDTLIKEDATAIAASPWNRREKSRQGPGEIENPNLDQVAQSVLDEFGQNEKFAFEVIPSLFHNFGVDYFLGDKMTSKYEDLGVTANLSLLGITMTFGGGIEILDHSFGEITA